MRAQWFFVCFLVLIARDVVAHDDASSASSEAPVKQIFKPEAFQTLVNPNCSHCVDEAKRRAADLRDDDRVVANTKAAPFRCGSSSFPIA
jgi:hypothetical protein